MELQETCRTCSISDSNDLARVSKSYVYIDGGIVSISNILLDLLSVNFLFKHLNILVTFYAFRLLRIAQS